MQHPNWVLFLAGRGGGMVDAVVSNTIGVKPVRVRVPPPAPGSWPGVDNLTETVFVIRSGLQEIPLASVVRIEALFSKSRPMGI